MQSMHYSVWRLAGPIILSNLSVPLVGIVDTAVVGHLPDPVYIGAVAIGSIIFNLVFWGFGFLRMTTSGLVAQTSGAQNGNELRALLARSIILALLLGCLLLILQAPILSMALQGFDTGGGLSAPVHEYYSIRIWAAPATLVNYAILGALIGLQNTRYVFVVQLVLNLTNIALDLLFVVVLQMTVDGVALATLISEYLAMIVGIMLLRHQLRLVAGHFVLSAIFRWKQLAALLVMNANILIRTVCLIGAFYLFTALGTRLGPELLAANAVLMHLLHAIAYGLDGFAHAAETLVGHAIGAGNADRLRQAVRTTSLWAVVIALLWGCAYGLFGYSLIALITDIDEVRLQAREFLPWLIVAPVVSVWSYQLDGIFIGATRTVEMRNAMLISLAFFVITSLLLFDAWANHGLWLSLMLFNAMRAVTLMFYYPRISRTLPVTKM